VRGELPLSDRVVVLIILVVIIFSDILQGVIFGFFIAIILLAMNYLKLSVIKIETNASAPANNVNRGFETHELLDKESNRFDYLVLDFHHVSQHAISAIVTFSKLAQLSERVGFHDIISSLDDDSIKELVKHRFFTFADLT